MASAVAMAADGPLRPIQPAKAAPALTGQGLDGKAVDLKSMRGRVVLVNFWATWCDPCREELLSIEILRDKFKDRPFEVLLVNYGEMGGKVSSFLANYRVSLPVVLDVDKNTAAAWKVGGLPTTFIVDATGRQRYMVLGERDWSDADSVKAIEKLLEEAGRARR
jgi:thiol-disulfide isomerase/thioredoxin